MKPAVKLTFDSGAFSAWRRGIEINLTEYIDFLIAHADVSPAYVNLDVIPKRREPADVEEAAGAGWRNFVTMRKAGLEPIPVFHRGERRYWLEKMIGEGCRYIGLGGVATVRDRERRVWFDEMFGYLCGAGGFPSLKVHGFGVTSAASVLRYPWYSVDSISWISAARTGSCLIPVPGDRAYTSRPFVVGFSRGGSVKGLVNQQHLNGNHFDALGITLKRHVADYVHESGFTVAELSTSRERRIHLNIKFFHELSKHHPHHPFVKPGAGLFGSGGLPGSRKPVGRFRMMFTTDGEVPINQSLTDEGCRHRLVSYYLMNGALRRNIREFVATGLVPQEERRREAKKSK